MTAFPTISGARRGRTSRPAGFNRFGLLAMTVSLALGIAQPLFPRATSAQSAGLPASASVAPEDTLLYVSIPLETTGSQWIQGDALAQRAAGQSIDDLVASLLERVTTSSSGLSPSDPAFAGGEIAVVVTGVQAAEQQLGRLTEITDVLPVPALDRSTIDAGQGAALIIEPGNFELAVALVQDALDSAAASTGNDVASEPYQGVDVRSVAPDADGNGGVAAVRVGSFLLVAPTPIDLQPLIDTAVGGAPSLADLDAFAEASDLLPADRLAFGFGNGFALEQSVTESSTGGALVGESLPRLVGDSRYIGFTLAAEPTGFRLDTVEIPRASAPGTPSTGSPADDFSLGAGIPDDAVIYASGFDLGQSSVLQAASALLVSLVSGIASISFEMPGTTPTIDDLDTQLSGLLGFDLRADLVDQLTGPYAFAVWNVDVANPAEIDALLISEVESPDILASSIGSLSLLIGALSQGQVEVTSTEVGDDTVTEFAIGGASLGSPVRIDVGVVDERFVLGVGDGIEQYAAGVESDLASSPAFTAALESLPADIDGVLYIDVQQAIGVADALDSASGGQDAGVADDACSAYASQVDAQSAYDANPLLNLALDRDIDGTACEDSFVPATSSTSTMSEYTGVTSLLTVSYEKDGYAYTSAILTIDE